MNDVTIKPRIEKINSILRGLEEKFPAAFMPGADHQKPLKVGIWDDIAATLGETDDIPLTKAAVGYHVRRKCYLVSMTAGAQRVDLNGEPVADGIVTDEQATWAAIKLENAREKARRRDDESNMRRNARRAAERNDPVLKQKRAKSRHGAMLAARRVLVNKWPQCFMPFGEPKKPLKRDIIADIQKRMHENEWKSLPFAWAVNDYQGGKTYKDNCVDGAPMIDLDGKVVAHIGDWQRKNQSAPKAVTRDVPSHNRVGGHHVPIEKVSQSEQSRQILSSLGIQNTAPRKAPVVVVKRRRLSA